MIFTFELRWSVSMMRAVGAAGGALLALFVAGGTFFLDAQDYRQNEFKNDPRSLPFPRELVLKVEFWKGVYTKYNTNQGILHDADDLSIIYDAIELPRGGDMFEVERLRNQIREHIFNILRKRGDNLTLEERKILARFPANTSRSRLLQATENIRFQLGQADRFRAGVIRSGAYLKHIEKILREEGVPDFLKYLPHVESSFQEHAMSKFGAAGLWQLMPATGKLYLKVGYEVDERLDPITATRAAARHLKRDFEKLGTWPLAVTAYNHGAGGIMRAVQNLGTNDIAEIAFRYSSPSFGFASRNFYAQFLAAIDVASHYQKYFGDIAVTAPLAFEAVTIERPTYFDEFSQGYRFTAADFKKLNPGLREPVLSNRRPIPRGTTLRLPFNSKRQPVLVASVDKSAAVQAVQPKKIPVLSAKPIAAVKKADVKTLPSKYAVHDVLNGKGWISVEMNETLVQVAEWLKVSAEDLRTWNGIDPQGQARLGQKLILQVTPSSVLEFQQNREDYHKKTREDFFSRYDVTKTLDYEVRRGENLWSLCYQKFEIPPWLLEDYNPKVSLSALAPGVKLKIPVLREKDSSPMVSSANR